MMRIAWFIRHQPYAVSSKIVATEIRIKVYIFLQHHHQLSCLIIFCKQVIKVSDFIYTLPSTTRMRFHVQWKSTEIVNDVFPVHWKFQVAEGLLRSVIRSLIGRKKHCFRNRHFDLFREAIVEKLFISTPPERIIDDGSSCESCVF